MKMLRIAFIGYGSMGSMLLQGFIKSGVITPAEIIVSTRTKSKLDVIKKNWPGINIAGDNAEAVRKAKYVFVCVEPVDVKQILIEIKDCLSPDSVIVSMAGTVSMKNIEALTGAKVIRLIPSLTSEVGEGLSLVCCNDLVGREEADYFETLLGSISKVKRLSEDELGLATILASSGPGLFAAILDELVQSALRQNSALAEKDIEDMVTRTFYGTAKVLAEKNMSFDEMVTRVATKGGTTEEGVKVFKTALPETFDKMFDVMIDKRKKVSDAIDKAFG